MSEESSLLNNPGTGSVEEGFHVKARWLISDTELPSYANQFRIHPGIPSGTVPEDAILIFGNLNPPIFQDGMTPEMLKEAVEAEYPVVPVATVLMNIGRLRQLQATVGAFLEGLPDDND